LHGGSQGFDKVFWQGQQQDNTVIFTHASTANAEGYPGNLTTTVTYHLTDDNELKIQYHATTDAPTPVNLTNHTYWNLAGAGSGDILAHELEIFAEQYLETDQRNLPTGLVLTVSDSAYDFQARKKIGEHIAQIRGYDHCYVLQSDLAARVRDPNSDRKMEVRTSKPGMQFYSGNYLMDTQIAQDRHTQKWGGFCLETQSFPDAVNQPHFPSIILLPEQVYDHSTTYKFYFSANG
jgi:aldose 1-epimerase